jgi:methylated-DNA-[protein]-cysteine S-methyltransferase
MTGHGLMLFATAIGRCGIVWGGAGIAGVQLPEASDAATRARLLRRFPDAREASPPPDVRRAIAGIAGLLRGEPRDLSPVALDMARVPHFHRRVYEVARTIPPGGTLSYGDVAARLGTPGAARAVGRALGCNPFALIVPCHRVVAAGGKVGGFSAGGGGATKLRLLAIEGARSAASPLGAGGGSRVARSRETPGLFDGDGRLGFVPRVAVAHLRASDPALARVIDAAGPMRLELKRTPSLFGALAEAIVYQQLSGKAAATIFARVCALFPRAREGPRPAAILRTPDAKLRAAGLSRPKLLALRDLAHRTADGGIPTLADVHRMEDEAIIEHLTAVRGIGRWTVEMLLIFRLGRPDVLPADDYGIRKGFAVAFKRPALPTRADVEKRGARWRPYRSAASWYLWRAAELAPRRRAPMPASRRPGSPPPASSRPSRDGS